MQAPSTLLKHATEPYALLPLLAAALVGAVWWITLTLVERDEQRAALEAARVTERLADTYEAQTLRLINDVNQTMKLVDYATSISGAASSVEQLRTERLLPPGLFFTIRVVDQTGKVLAASRSGPPIYALPSGALARPASTGLTVGAPHETTGESGPVIDFARPMQRLPPGHAPLVTIVTVPGSYLVSDYDEVRFGKAGVLAVMGTDGVFRAKRVGERITSGETVAAPVAFPADGEEHQGAALINAPWDGRLHYVSGRRISSAALTVLVALPEEEQLATVRTSASRLLGEAAVASLLIALVAVVLARMSWRVATLRQKSAQERAAHAQQIEHMAFHDPLTGLPNRLAFNRLLGQHLDTANGQGHMLAVMFLDLDGFKGINDRLGHEAGDELLRQVARRLVAALRAEEDVVSRLGGDEFVVILPTSTSEADIARVAERIVRSIAAPYELPQGIGHITVSVGVVQYPRDGLDAASLVTNADEAMYLAKRGGKNQVAYYPGRHRQSSSITRSPLR